MKLSITLLLCASLLQSTEPRLSAEAPPKDSLILAGVLLSICAVGAIAVIYVYGKYEEQTGPVTLVLLRSYSHGAGTWSAIATNTVTLNGQQPIEFFRTNMTDPTAFYKVRVVD